MVVIAAARTVQRLDALGYNDNQCGPYDDSFAERGDHTELARGEGEVEGEHAGHEGAAY